MRLEERPAGPDTRSSPGGVVAGMLTGPRFELVPVRGVDEQISHLPQGVTVTVTSSPRKGMEPTLALCESLARGGFRAVPHVSARLIRSASHLEETADRMAEAGIREIFAVGGDSPEPAGPYRSAMEMLVALGEMGRSFDEVGIAGYPERHPLVEDRELLRALLDKQPFATYLVSQICFDPRSVFEWMGRIRRAGFRLPVHIGMPGAVSRVRLLEISFRIGVGESVRYLKKSGSLVSRLVRRSSFRPDAFLAGVAAQLERGAENVVGFHINTFNQVDRTERWRTEALARFGSGPQPAAESSP